MYIYIYILRGLGAALGIGLGVGLGLASGLGAVFIAQGVVQFTVMNVEETHSFNCFKAAL